MIKHTHTPYCQLEGDHLYSEPRYPVLPVSVPTALRYLKSYSALLRLR